MAQPELLLADLWLGVVERFQSGVLAELDGDDVVDTAVRVALYMPKWVRANLQDARLLLVHHRQDFVAGAWPDELVARAAALEPQLARGLRLYCRRRFGSVREADMQRARFALLDAPYGAVKPYVRQGRPPPKIVENLDKAKKITRPETRFAA